MPFHRLRRYGLILFLVIVAGRITLSLSASAMGTTVIVVRHAEKVDHSANPDLSPKGFERAERLSNLLRYANVKALFATQFKRTQQTLKPLASMADLKIQVISAYEPAKLVRKIMKSYAGDTVVVASHSDLVAVIIEALGGRTIGAIPEQEYDNLFIVTILGDTGARVVRLKY